ncbi:gamma-aminobutyric acid receptor alpha-like isoform X2 [Paramacrobiotus metropolitanus]|uniref:gamma-aminobutyric acid receptor alpha-like isoform X2 n=1 Tax=Paramacrobiotus metropolitanus TaxID=2943436 RepID=UPI002446493F|nr:gamma-aminobutyric acid receptor alpha-like isoform X2 [Paramacrobiotus metropolitanus]
MLITAVQLFMSAIWFIQLGARSAVSADHQGTPSYRTHTDNMGFRNVFSFSANIDDANLTSVTMIPTATQANESTHIQSVTDIIDTLLMDYDIKARPPGPTTEVLVDIVLRSMGTVSESQFEYSIDCYFRQSWIDRRLSYGQFSNISAALLPLGVTVLQKIWKPDTTVFNGKPNSYVHDITSPNKFIRIYRDGTLIYSQRLTLRARCPMQLQRYPMDTQHCPLDLGSFAYTKKDVVYKWKYGNAKAVVLAEDLKLSQFYLLNAVGFNSTRITPLGEYSMLSVEFTLQRHSGYFLIQIYAPCILTVVLSWVQFWLNREASGDRITLGVTCVLTMTFLGIDTRSGGDYPRVSYMTALDLFVSMSFVYIFLSIVLYAFVHINTKYGTGDSYHRWPAEVLCYDTPERRTKFYQRKLSRALSQTYGSRRRYSIANCSRVDELHLREADYARDINGGPLGKELTESPERKDSIFSAFLAGNSCQKFLRLCFGIHPYRSYFDKDTKKFVENMSHGRINSISQIDRTCRVAFPVSFTIFMSFYFWYYSSESNAK